MNKKISKKTNNTGAHNVSITDKKELDTLIYIILYLGLVYVHNYKSFFNKKSLAYNSFIASRMTVQRFTFLYSCFSMFSVEDKENGFIVKEPKIISYVNVNSINSFTPKENICIDEALCALKGRVLNRVFAPQKPTKLGIKLYVCADSETGFILKSIICGQSNTLENIVMSLSLDFAGSWRILHMDNLYNSIKLTEKLFFVQIHTNGTLRRCIGVPAAIMDDIPERHNTNITRINDHAYYFNFYDSKVVSFISTVCRHDTFQRQKKIWARDKTTHRKVATLVEQNISKAIVEYNKNMNGVDKANQCIKMFNLKKASKKWDRKLSIHIIEMLLHNSYILFDQSDEPKKINRSEFVELIAKKLLRFYDKPEKLNQHVVIGESREKETKLKETNN